MPNHFDSEVTVTGPKADIDKLVAALKAAFNCFCILTDPPPAEMLNGRLPPIPGFTINDFAVEHGWGPRWPCQDMAVKRTNDEKAVFTFWTALSLISHRIAAGLHEKYPTLAFVFMGCDEFEYPMKLQWSVKPGETTDHELMAKAMRAVNQAKAIICFCDDITGDDIPRIVQQAVMNACNNDNTEARACLRLIMKMIYSHGITKHHLSYSTKNHFERSSDVLRVTQLSEFANRLCTKICSSHNSQHSSTHWTCWTNN
jgi:hypothetical protein